MKTRPKVGSTCVRTVKKVPTTRVCRDDADQPSPNKGGAMCRGEAWSWVHECHLKPADDAEATKDRRQNSTQDLRNASLELGATVRQETRWAVGGRLRSRGFPSAWHLVVRDILQVARLPEEVRLEEADVHKPTHGRRDGCVEQRGPAWLPAARGGRGEAGTSQ